jgi:hypothetical protein
MLILDKVLGKQTFNYIKNQIVDTNTFPWYVAETTYPSNDTNAIFATNLVHIALSENGSSDLFNVIYPIILNIFDNANENITKLLRIRLALQTPINKPYINDAHVDSSVSHKTAIFYIKNSDGNTIVYNEKYDPNSGINTEVYRQKILNNNLTIYREIEPVENRLVLFNGHNYHASQKPVNYNSRIILNINYI